MEKQKGYPEMNAYDLSCLLQSSVHLTMSNKQAATHFLKLCAHGNPAEAFALYAAPNFKHHNAFYKGDAASLQRGMEEAAAQQPHVIFTIHHAVEEDDMVSCHSHFKSDAGHAGVAVAHIFRFEANKITELWDFGQEVPADMANENGMF